MVLLLHLSNATLPCEDYKTENVTLQRDITKENCMWRIYHSFIKEDQGHQSPCALNLLIWSVIQQYVYETKIHDIDDLRKRLMQTWFDCNHRHHRWNCQCNLILIHVTAILQSTLKAEVVFTCIFDVSTFTR